MSLPRLSSQIVDGDTVQQLLHSSTAVLEASAAC